jgi:hypothetical protein
MRRLLVPLLALLVLPAAAYSAQPSPGTLSIKEARGMVYLNAKGSITGRFARGKLTITDPNPYDSRRPVVYGATKIFYRGDRTTIYQGQNIRFRLIGARYQVRIEARGIFLSAIARGKGMIDGAGDPGSGIFYDGVWSLNDEAYHSLPDEQTKFDLISPPVAG